MLESPKNKVILARLVKFHNNSSDGAFVEFSNKKLLVFFPDFTAYGWFDLEKNGKLWALENKAYPMTFSLLSFEQNVTSEQKKYVKYISAYEYKINGKIVGKHNRDITVNCGFELSVFVPSDFSCKVGDWIRAQGRLDAYLVNGKD